MTISFDIAHDVAGDGPDVILLHSTVCDRRMWDPQVPALTAAGFRVTRADFRGYGETPMPDKPFNYAQDVSDLMDRLGIERAALVGSSGGGQVALEIAARWPARITSLILICTAMAGHEPSADLRAFGEREDELLEAGDVAGATDLNVDTWVGPEADDATREKVRAMQRHAFEVQLAPVGDDVVPIRVETDPATITARTLLISGAHDLADFREIAVELAGRIPGARHAELDWAGHLPTMERPGELNSLLVATLSA